VVSEESLLASQQSTICMYSEPDQYSLCPVAFFSPLYVFLPVTAGPSNKDFSFFPDVCEHCTYVYDTDVPFWESFEKHVEEVINGVGATVLDVSGQQHGEEEADNFPHRHEQECVVSRGLQFSEEFRNICGQEKILLLIWLSSKWLHARGFLLRFSQCSGYIGGVANAAT